MACFDYSAPAELFSPVKAGVKRSSLQYRRFGVSADAIQFAMEALPDLALRDTVMEVDDTRFDAASIRELYDSVAYPLPRERD